MSEGERLRRNRVCRTQKAIFSNFLILAVISTFRYLSCPVNLVPDGGLVVIIASFVLPFTSEGLVLRRQVFGLISKAVMAPPSLHLLTSSELPPENSAGATISSSSTETGSEADDIAARQQRIRERRQLMEASRSSNNRQSYLDLSRQRALLYNTTSKAATCPPSIPCL